MLALARPGPYNVVSDSDRTLTSTGFGLGCEVFSRIDEAIALEAVLLVVQLPVPPAFGHQLFVRPALDDFAPSSTRI